MVTIMKNMYTMIKEKQITKEVAIKVKKKILNTKKTLLNTNKTKTQNGMMINIEDKNI